MISCAFAALRNTLVSQVIFHFGPFIVYAVGLWEFLVMRLAIYPYEGWRRDVWSEQNSTVMLWRRPINFGAGVRTQ